MRRFDPDWRHAKRRSSMRRTMFGLVAAALLVLAIASAPSGSGRIPQAYAASLAATPVADWSNEARRTIVPAGPGGVFGAENYGNKFPGEAAVYMGIVHAAMYDAALAIQGGYQPYAIRLPARRDASPAAAISTAAHHVLVDLQPALGLTAEQQAGLDARYTAYLAALPDGSAKTDGVAVGEQVAAAYRTLRARDGRDDNPQLGQPPLVPPPAGPGVWDQGAAPAVGLRMPGIRPLALPSASHFRPGGPTPLESEAYAADLQQVTDLGAAASVSRTEEQTCHRAVLDRPRPSSME